MLYRRGGVVVVVVIVVVVVASLCQAQVARGGVASLSSMPALRRCGRVVVVVVLGDTVVTVSWCITGITNIL